MVDLLSVGVGRQPVSDRHRDGGRRLRPGAEPQPVADLLSNRNAGRSRRVDGSPEYRQHGENKSYKLTIL